MEDYKNFLEFFSKEDLDDFKFGIKKGLIHGKINVRGIPPLHFKESMSLGFI